ncbi:MAG TPA: tetratricopeptide repeat protein [Bryobacteraceae bacterium]|nr:tetratricopeptide repeat protein [Bryobacteraceae bacterium]
MLRVLVPWLAVASAAFAAAPAPVYELSGRILPQRLIPRSGASVSLFGTTTPFTTSTLADVTGHFRFKKLKPGLYSLAIFVRRRGEARRTVEVGPAAADPKGRVQLTWQLHDSDWVPALSSSLYKVWATQLSVPQRAINEYRDAQKNLSRHDVAAAVKRLEQAVDLAPQFSAAWNNLGTIAYQSNKFDRAEECFREALTQDPQSYEALVNLGGVLVTIRKLDEAMKYNVQAVLTRPNDPLANAQLGMAYFLLREDDLAAKYLEHARELDPASFTYPQLLLSEIHFRQGDKGAAADVLEDFLTHHPDWPQATKMRETIAGLRGASGH